MLGPLAPKVPPGTFEASRLAWDGAARCWAGPTSKVPPGTFEVGRAGPAPGRAGPGRKPKRQNSWVKIEKIWGNRYSMERDLTGEQHSKK